MSPDPILKWKSFPFADRPLASLFLMCFIFLLSILLWQIAVVNWSSPPFFYLGMLLMIVNLFPYFILTQYMMFEDRIEIYYLFFKVTRYYSDFGCFYQDKHGVMLSTFKMPRRLDTFRGQSLRFSKTKEEKTKLVEILKDKIGKKY